MSQPMVSESGLMARLAARAADLAERGQPGFPYSAWTTMYTENAPYAGASFTGPDMSMPGTTISFTNSAYYATNSWSTTGATTLEGYSLASALAESSYVLGWTFTDQPTYATAPAFAQATCSLAASAAKALSDYSDDGPHMQGAAIHDQIRVAVDMLLTELSARIGDACQHGNTGAVAAKHRNQSKSPELVWIVITALLSALALLLSLMVYFFPPN
jgi:hypothetical protein